MVKDKDGAKPTVPRLPKVRSGKNDPRRSARDEILACDDCTEDKKDEQDHETPGPRSERVRGTGDDTRWREGRGSFIVADALLNHR